MRVEREKICGPEAISACLVASENRVWLLREDTPEVKPTRSKCGDPPTNQSLLPPLTNRLEGERQVGHFLVVSLQCHDASRGWI